jgi:pimeloyl-ACP methyl ester carboxylesterase
MAVKKAFDVGPSGIEIAYESFGDAAAPPVLLIMGLGSQMLSWPEGFIAGFISGGLRPIRFDNRDAGLSTHFPDAPQPDFPAALAGDTSSASYNLSDMAADTVGLLDALGIGSAHLVGASMGGFIAQTVAIEHSERVRSLTSMMSTTGDPSVGQPDPDTARLFAGQATTREEVMDRAVVATSIVGSPAYPVDEVEVRERAGLAYDRSFDPTGLVRQAIAVLASGDRTDQLRSLKVPTLVIHGAADKMIAVSGGIATSDAIPGAELVIIEGMGHNLPPALWPRITSLIADHIHRVEAGALGA